MKTAIIGCGRIAINHITAIKNNQLTLAGVCDVLPEAMDALLEKGGLSANPDIAKHTSYIRLLEEVKPELCAISTESGLHAKIALACIERGVHVIIEKPMAMSTNDAAAIIEASKKHNVKVTVCHQNRFNLAVKNMRSAVESGRFGKLSHGSIHVRWNRNENYYTQAPWRGTWAQDGGCLMNQCIHGIDLLLWMMGGEPVSVYGVTRQQFHPYLEAEDVGLAVIEFANGAVATVEGTVNVYPKNLEETLYLFGETGTVKLGGTSTNHIDVWDFAEESPEDTETRGLQEATSNVYGNGHTSLYADMVDAVKTGREPYITAEDGKTAMEMVLAIYKSRQQGAKVLLPLESFASADMQGTFSKR